MFKELLDKSSQIENKTAIYRILSKDANTITSGDWADLSRAVSAVAELENVNPSFLVEETVMSLYELLSTETGGPDMPQFFAVCSTVVVSLEGKFSEAELTALVECLETLRWLWRETITDIQGFYDSFEKKLAKFSPSRYCTGMFRRRILDIIIQIGSFLKMRSTIQALSETILSLDEDSFEKSILLINEFMSA